MQKTISKIIFEFAIITCLTIISIQSVEIGSDSIAGTKEESEEVNTIESVVPEVEEVRSAHIHYDKHSRGTPIKRETPDEIFLGKFESTAYIATGNPCANGEYPVPYKTCAVDPKVIPLGTKLKVRRVDTGQEFIVKATDTGGLIKGRIIDMFLPSYDEAIQWGRRDVEIWIIEEQRKDEDDDYS